jgi:hypothetical protein
MRKPPAVPEVAELGEIRVNRLNPDPEQKQDGPERQKQLEKDRKSRLGGVCLEHGRKPSG